MVEEKRRETSRLDVDEQDGRPAEGTISVCQRCRNQPAPSGRARDVRQQMREGVARGQDGEGRQGASRARVSSGEAHECRF